VNPSLLDSVRVPYHGSPTPILKLAYVATDGLALMVRPFDPGDTQTIAKAISESPLGLTAQVAKTTIRVPIPPLSQERRAELAKAASRLAEEARVAMRNVRRDALRAADELDLPHDDRRAFGTKIEELARRYLAGVDESLAAKARDLSGEDERWRPSSEPKRAKRKERPKLKGDSDGIDGVAC
jgi:ribosome recycling factor